jgi:hypothetical protein
MKRILVAFTLLAACAPIATTTHQPGSTPTVSEKATALPEPTLAEPTQPEAAKKPYRFALPLNASISILNTLALPMSLLM